MHSTIRTILSIVSSGFLITTAIDMLQWSFSGEYKNTAESLIIKMMDTLVQMPTKLLYAVFNVLIGLIESAVKMVLSLLGLNSAADKVKLHYLDA